MDKKKIEKVRRDIFFFDETAAPKPKRLTAEEKEKIFGRMDKDHKKQFEKVDGINN